MKKKLLSLFLVGVLAASMVAGCGKTEGKRTKILKKQKDQTKKLLTVTNRSSSVTRVRPVEISLQCGQTQHLTTMHTK